MEYSVAVKRVRFVDTQRKATSYTAEWETNTLK